MDFPKHHRTGREVAEAWNRGLAIDRSDDGEVLTSVNVGARVLYPIDDRPEV